MEGTENTATIDQQTTDASGEEKQTTPTTEELMARIAEAEARAAKAEQEREVAKRAADKASKEAAERKREALANMTDEQAKAAAAEEERQKLLEENEAMRKEINHSKAVAAYKSLSDVQAVENLIEAVMDADHATIAAIMAAEVQRAVKVAQAEWMKSRPPVNAGGEYSSMTKEQIMAIPDAVERRKAIAANLELFDNN